MSDLLFELLLRSANRAPQARALTSRVTSIDYATLATQTESFAGGLMELGLGRLERVAIYLPKQLHTVVGMFGAARAGCVFVPVNPLLKPPQVAHILRDVRPDGVVCANDFTAAQLMKTLQRVDPAAVE